MYGTLSLSEKIRPLVSRMRMRVIRIRLIMGVVTEHSIGRTSHCHRELRQ